MSEPEPYVKLQTVSQSFEEAKSYTVKRSKVSDEHQKMVIDQSNLEFSERNTLTRGKADTYKRYLQIRLGCEDVRIHNWKLGDLSNDLKEDDNQQQDVDVIVEFSCEGYFHNKFRISDEKIKEDQALIRAVYTVSKYEDMDLSITDKKLLEQQIQKTTSWIREKKQELQTEDNQKLKKKIEKAEQALVNANKLVQRAPPKTLFGVSEVESSLRKVFADTYKDEGILTKDNNGTYMKNIQQRDADPFDYLRWWYQQYEKMPKLEIILFNQGPRGLSTS